MIQRIQSVFLLIMALVMLSILFFPIWVKGSTETGEMVVLSAFQLTFKDISTDPARIISTYDTFYIAILCVLSAGVAIFSIFQYKNRLNQIKLGALNSLLIGGVVLCNYLFSDKGTDMIAADEPANFKIGFFLPVLALLFNSLANRFIRRDEKLVQSTNRMR